MDAHSSAAQPSSPPARASADSVAAADPNNSALSSTSRDEANMFNESNISDNAAAPNVGLVEDLAPLVVHQVQVVLERLPVEWRRSQRNLQSQLRGLAGGMQLGTPPTIGGHVVQVGEPIIVDASAIDASAIEPEAMLNAAQEDVEEAPIIVLDTETSTPTSGRKRRRINSQTPTPPKVGAKVLTEDDDDGSTCPICLDSWEMSGDHRLTSLKCGHLFGESCIRRWFTGTTANQRCCPSCKSKANLRDIRSIYAKRVSVVDKSEEYRLQTLLDEELVRVGALNQEVALLNLELEVQRKFNAKLESQLEHTKMNAINLNASLMSASQQAGQSHHGSVNVGSELPRVYRLSRECTINICADPGCRVLIHGRRSNNLIVSQKSVQQLFPGFGVRFVDLPTFRLTSFLHMAAKQIRDLAFDQDEQLLAAASMDITCKLFNVNNRGCCATFAPCDKPIWSVAFDRVRTRTLYFGTQHGSTYTYDLRQPGSFIDEYRTANDMSPVINISGVDPYQPEFPFGGFLVCKLQSLWFYEYTGGQEVTATRLAVDGPFVSMTYAADTRTVLVSTRPTSTVPASQLIYARLRKVVQTTTLHVIVQIPGSYRVAVMSRCAQVHVDDTTMVVSYMQDTKMLKTWQVRDSKLLHVPQQVLPIDECVLDACPMYGVAGGQGQEQVFVGALTETKCRIFKVYNEMA